MEMVYVPGLGLKLGDAEIKWGTPRTKVRLLLGLDYEEDNDDEFLMRRDIYWEVDGSTDRFFLSYDSNDLLSEFEAHNANNLSLFGLYHIFFNKSITITVDRLKRTSPVCIEIETGNYLFKDLYFCIADADSMGGEGDMLAYFYAARDISHLIK